MRELLRELGVNLPDLIAGFCGGVANAFVMGNKNPWAVVGSVIVGAMMANYAGAALGERLGLSPGFASFLTGLCAMVLCQGALETARKWKMIQQKREDR